MRLELDINPIVNQNLSFQFHKGAIRTTAQFGSESVVSYFNSIKVRLELPRI